MKQPLEKISISCWIHSRFSSSSDAGVNGNICRLESNRQAVIETQVLITDLDAVDFPDFVAEPRRVLTLRRQRAIIINESGKTRGRTRLSHRMPTTLFGLNWLGKISESSCTYNTMSSANQN